MNGKSKLLLIDLLHVFPPDFNRLINTFIIGYNTAHGTAGNDCWDIETKDWQRYEFLGDRVLNLIVAESLFVKKDMDLDEGEMTGILSSVVSNRALDTLVHQYEKDSIMRLIPHSIREQNSYGERITGGAFEAFIGALYYEVGLENVAFFVNAIMKNRMDTYNPQQNSIGILQEHVQKTYKTLPEYRETVRVGPDHKPVFTYKVFFNGCVYGEGSGESKLLARQAAAKAAKMALDKLP